MSLRILFVRKFSLPQGKGMRYLSAVQDLKVWSSDLSNGWDDRDGQHNEVSLRNRIEPYGDLNLVVPLLNQCPELIN